MLDKAATAGDDYQLDKCGPTGLCHTGPLRGGKERQRQWIPKREL
jgi:hypothetical protein